MTDTNTHPGGWENRAKRAIAALCRESYRHANAGRKRHVPYSVPETAQDLIECLNTGDEERAKAILIHDYDLQRVERQS